MAMWVPSIDYYIPLYWACVVSTMLLGMTHVQTYIYFSRSKDPVLFQTIVAAVVFFDTIDTLLISIAIFHYFVESFGDYTTLTVIVDVWWLETGVTSIVTAAVQIFFASRIYFIMRQYPILMQWNKVIPMLAFMTAAGGLGAGFAKMLLIHLLSRLADPKDFQLIVATCSEETFALLSDGITTVTLCYILASAPGGVIKTRSRIQRVFLFVLTRGILVTIVQVGALVAYAVDPVHLYAAPFNLCKSKMYTNTLLAMLNARKSTERWTTKDSVN